MHTISRCVITALSLICTPLFAAAGPIISFNVTSFFAGVASEGQTEKLNAVFVVKNTGDAVLKLENVRPACGCTKVRYDSLIQPGKTGKIDAELDIHTFGGGPLSKAIVVTSNAENEPIGRLIVKATIQPMIGISEQTLCINLTNTAQKRLTFTSRKTDLKITGIYFKREADKTTTANWKNDVPLTLEYQWQPTDSTNSDGYKVYRLTFLRPIIAESMLGEFLIKTNHPSKPEIVLVGTILK